MPAVMAPTLALALSTSLLLGGQTPAAAPPAGRAPARTAPVRFPTAETPSPEAQAPLPPAPNRSPHKVKGPGLFLPTVIGGAVGLALGVTSIVAGCMAWMFWVPVMTGVLVRYVDRGNGVLTVDEKAEGFWDMASAYWWKWGTNFLVAGVFAWALGSVGVGAGLATMLLGFTLPRE